MNTLWAVCVCALFAVVSSENFVISSTKCIEETGVSDEVISDANTGTFANDPKLAKYLVCAGKEVGVIDEHNHVNKEALKSQMLKRHNDEAIVNAALDKCVVEKGNIEETSLEISKCIFAEFHK